MTQLKANWELPSYYYPETHIKGKA